MLFAKQRKRSEGPSGSINNISITAAKDSKLETARRHKLYYSLLRFESPAVKKIEFPSRRLLETKSQAKNEAGR